MALFFADILHAVRIYLNADLLRLLFRAVHQISIKQATHCPNFYWL